jgi:hypothetical protein
VTSWTALPEDPLTDLVPVVRRGVEFNENEMSLWDGTLGVEMSK